jgi:hypothetical protein
MPSAGMSSSWGRVRLTPDGGKAGAHIGQIPGQCYPPLQWAAHDLPAANCSNPMCVPNPSVCNFGMRLRGFHDLAFSSALCMLIA